jgi:adenylyltransferase/sulfurtransferase
VLYDEEDVRAGLPKAVAAEAKLRKINSQVAVEPLVTDVDHQNILALLDGVDVILDGTDNFETRFLLNDAALKTGIPWVYGGCIGSEGQTMTILPGETPCLRCLIPEAPPPGTTATCDTAGILGSIVNVVASIQACEAIKILSGHREAVSRVLQVFELWDNRVRQVQLDALRESADCPACRGLEYPWLEGRRGGHTAVLCGRNAVQLSYLDRSAVSLPSLAKRLEGVGKVTANQFLLRLEVDAYAITVFPDGRAIVAGTDDIAEAKTVHARYIGT